MHRLLLIRHARAAAFGPVPGDHDRPLSARGLAMAGRLGQILEQEGWAPDRALVSTAARTRQTWEAMVPPLPSCTADFEEALYLGAPGVFAKAISAHGGVCETLALVGHNPGVALMVQNLLDTGFDHDAMALRALGGHFKTGWAAAFEMRPQGPRLAALFDPRRVISSM